MKRPYNIFLQFNDFSGLIYKIMNVGYNLGVDLLYLLVFDACNPAVFYAMIFIDYWIPMFCHFMEGMVIIFINLFSYWYITDLFLFLLLLNSIAIFIFNSPMPIMILFKFLLLWIGFHPSFIHSHRALKIDEDLKLNHSNPVKNYILVHLELQDHLL